MPRLFITMVISAMIMISGCRTLSPEPETGHAVDIPQAFSNQTKTSKAEPAASSIENWWRILASDELNTLIVKGLSQNYDVKVKEAKVAQASATLEKEKAALKPSLDYSFGGEKGHTRTKKSGQGTVSGGTHSWDASLSADYTLDVWGQISAAVKARTLELEAARQDLNDTSLELSADIAETWVNIVAVRTGKMVLQKQIEINQTHLELQKLRFLNGRASALDVSQQREALAQALSSMPLLEKEEGQLLNSLGYLLGETPGLDMNITTQELPEMLFQPQPGIPVDLLENRADIRAARERLEASRQEVEEAKADMMPSFTLSASALFSSGSLDLLFQNWVASLGAALAGPLFDGGLRQAEVERTRAVVQEDLNLYARTISNAILEVEDSLVGIDRQLEYVKRLEQELETVRLTLKDARVQYLNGQSSYLNYLTAWARIESLERQLVSERANYVKERITLHRVIGWNDPVLKTTEIQPNAGAK
ncbi:MAG: efflux transporter outer membrane subunit [Desulfobacterales bacterium]|nr:efflux transporter outer membrane subunit [Desulfobacterales bacterium]